YRNHIFQKQWDNSAYKLRAVVSAYRRPEQFQARQKSQHGERDAVKNEEDGVQDRYFAEQTLNIQIFNFL
ncbi:hypothetical protein STEG23_009717, partial [Scotinomys teguina]